MRSLTIPEDRKKKIEPTTRIIAGPVRKLPAREELGARYEVPSIEIDFIYLISRRKASTHAG